MSGEHDHGWHALSLRRACGAASTPFEDSGRATQRRTLLLLQAIAASFCERGHNPAGDTVRARRSSRLNRDVGVNMIQWEIDSSDPEARTWPGTRCTLRASAQRQAI